MLISASHDLVDYDLGHLPGVSSIVFFVPAPGIDTRRSPYLEASARPSGSSSLAYALVLVTK